MTTLEIILTAIIWIAYGVFCTKQIEDDPIFKHYVIFIIGAPLVFIIRIMYGAFGELK